MESYLTDKLASANVMIIVLLMVLATTMSSVSSIRPPQSEQVMRDTLKQVMRCPEWATDDDIPQPVAAFSPARYIQLVALVRKDSGENSCGRRTYLPFNLQKPTSWNFCGMGICSDDSCSCFKNFMEKKCYKFHGRCWLFYCRLVGCNRETPSLYCSCNPSLYGTQLARPIYYYDHGLESNYIPPPLGYATNAFVDSHLIREIGSGQYEIIGGNYYQENKEITSSNRKYREKEHPYHVPRYNYVHNPVHQSDNYLNAKNQRRYSNSYSSNTHRRYFRKNLIGGSEENAMSNMFYNSKVYPMNREREDFNVVETGPSLIEDANMKDYNSPSSSVQQMPQRNYKRTRIKPANYLENTEDTDLRQYKRNKLYNDWRESKRKSLNRLKKYNLENNLNYNDWYKEKYRPDKEFGNGRENKRTFYNRDNYRVNREDPLEDNTIQEAWADDEEADDEDFDFSTGSQNDKHPFLELILLCVVVPILLYSFLE